MDKASGSIPHPMYTVSRAFTQRCPFQRKILMVMGFDSFIDIHNFWLVMCRIMIIPLLDTFSLVYCAEILIAFNLFFPFNMILVD